MSTGLIDKPLDRVAASTHELTPVLGKEWQLSWKAAAVVGWLSIVFLLINHTPLSLAGTWRHMNNGHWITTHGQLPTSLRNVPLAEGMPFVSESWLFDSLSFVLASRFGPNAISSAIAVLTTLALLFWCGLLYRVSRNTFCVLLGSIALTLYWSAGFASLEPRILAASIFAGVMWCVLPLRPFEDACTNSNTNEQAVVMPAVRWFGIAALFVLWANVDGSFWVGLSVLFAIAFGQATSSYLKAGWRGFFAPHVQQWFWIAQVSTLATLVSPQHFRLWHFGLTTKLDGLFGDASSGRGLYIPSIIGMGVVLLAAYAVFRFVRSELPVTAAEVFVSLVCFGLTMLSIRNVFWLVPITLLIAGRHWPTSAVGKAETKQADEDGQRPLRFAASLFAVLFVWCGFALSPISAPILGGKPRTAERLFDAAVPLEVSRFVDGRLTSSGTSEFGWTDKEVPLVFAPADWADWMLWDGPSELRVFANSEVHRLPLRAQSDYLRVFRGEADWGRVLDRYAVGTLVVDKTRQARLARSVMRNSKWSLVRETATSMTLERVSPAVRGEGGQS